MLWPVLLVAFLCQCEHGRPARPAQDPRLIALEQEKQSQRAFSAWLRQFTASYRRWLEDCVPLDGQVLAELQEHQGHYMEHRVLRAHYQSVSAKAHFADLSGLTGAGRLLRTILRQAPLHGLDLNGPIPAGAQPANTPSSLPAHNTNPPKDAQRYPNLLEELVALQQQALAVRGQYPAPSPLSGSEQELLWQELRQRNGDHADQAAFAAILLEQRMRKLLVGGDSVLNRIKERFSQDCARRRSLARATARLELTLADRFLRFSRQLSRGNTGPAALELAWREEAIKAQQERAQTAGATEEIDGLPTTAADTVPRPLLRVAPPKTAPTTETAKAAPAIKKGGMLRPGGDPLAILKTQGAEAYVQSLLLQDLASIVDTASLRRRLQVLQPPGEQYSRLLAAGQRYRKLVAEGGWSTPLSIIRLRPGRKDKAVLPLKERLQREGFFSGELNTHFDPLLSEAIRRYQETHQLPETGRPDRGLQRSLDVPASERLQAIELTLQRWRESAVGRTPYYVQVNIPDFSLEVWRKGKRLLRQRVVIGKSRVKKCDEETEREVLAYATPVQAGQIKTLIFSPYWNVTRAIKERELDPERGKDPFFYEKHGYEVLKPETRGEWVRQLPGPKNPLGFVKFIFPNPHETYLHDTADKQLFQRTIRAFSHGCIRVEEPMQLAQLLLQQDRQWESDAIQDLYRRWQSMDFAPLQKEWDADLYEKLLDRAEHLERTIELHQPVPIFVEYYTVRVDDSGQVHFLADIYDLDEQRVRPRPARKCIPESRRARRNFDQALSRLASLEQQAQELEPAVQHAQTQSETLEEQIARRQRRLLQRLKGLASFRQQHQNLSALIRHKHTALLPLVAKQRGRWPDRLLDRAIRLERLLKGFEALIQTAKTVSQQMSQLTAASQE